MPPGAARVRGTGMAVIAESADGSERTCWSIDELLPDAFGPDDLDRSSRERLAAIIGRRGRGGRAAQRRQVDAGQPLVGEKVAIVSDKPQTTRRDIRAIWTTDEAQVVFTDTPGFHKPRTRWGLRLNDLVGDAVAGVDVVVLVVDGRIGRRPGRCVTSTSSRWRANRRPRSICVVNKIDRHPPSRGGAAARGRAASWATGTRSCPSRPSVVIGVDTLLDLLVARMPEGPGALPRRRGHRSAARGAHRRARPRAGARGHAGGGAAFGRRRDRGDRTRGRAHSHPRLDRGGARLAEGHLDRPWRPDPEDDRHRRRASRSSRSWAARSILDLRVKVMKEWQRDPKMLDRLGF